MQPNHKFIPIACHYDEKTLLSKNGELLQTIRITGLVSEDNRGQDKVLREAVRKAIYDNLDSRHSSVYLHVTRTYKDIRLSSACSSQPAKFLDTEWNKYNKWGRQFLNTLYITVIHKALKQQRYIKKIFDQSAFAVFHQKSFVFLDQCLAALNAITSAIVSDLAAYKTYILTTIQQEDGTYYSEPLSFFHALTHLDYTPVILRKSDASRIVGSVDIEYQPNSLEIKNAGDSSRYAVVFILKYPYDLELQITDEILSIDHRLLITETILCTSGHRSISVWKEHYDTYTASNALDLIELSKTKALLEANKQKDNDYCKQQITITMYSDVKTDLQKGVGKLLSICERYGILVVREDFNLPRSFFAQIPSNFKLLTREKLTATMLSANFSSIHHRTAVGYSGSSWGSAVTIFKTIYGLPYYFNYHAGDCGNTLIFGLDLGVMKILSKFLVLQTTRLNPRILSITIDDEEDTDLFASIGGRSVFIENIETSPLKIDLFDLNNFHNDINELLRAILTRLLNSQNVKGDMEVIRGVVQSVVAAKSAEERKQLISSLTETDLTQTSLTALIKFLKSSVYKNLFSIEAFDDLLNERILNINMSRILKSTPEFRLVLEVFLARLPGRLKNEPAMIMLDKSDCMFTSDLLTGHLTEWLDALTAKSAIALFVLSNRDLVCNNQVFSGFLENFTTHIFLSEESADKHLRRALNLTGDELYGLRRTDQDNAKALLIKQGDVSVFAILPVLEISKMFQNVDVNLVA